MLPQFVKILYIPVINLQLRGQMTDAESVSPSSTSRSANTDSPDGTITDLEAAKLLLDAWKFRQGHSWHLLTRYYFAAVFISAIPYMLNDELVNLLKTVLLALPFLGGIIALAAIWLYAAEYVRAQSMNIQFRRILKNYGYYRLIDLNRFERAVLTPKIGWTTVYLLTACSILLSSINVIIVWRLVS